MKKRTERKLIKIPWLHLTCGDVEGLEIWLKEEPNAPISKVFLREIRNTLLASKHPNKMHLEHWGFSSSDGGNLRWAKLHLQNASANGNEAAIHELMDTIDAILEAPSKN